MASDVATEIPTELPPSAKYVLYVLRDVDEELALQEVAERTALERTTARYAIDKLLERGLVEQRANPRDRRSVLFSLA